MLKYTFLCEDKFLFPWNKCPRAQVLCQVVTAGSALEDTANLFSRVAGPLHLPSNNE